MRAIFNVYPARKEHAHRAGRGVVRGAKSNRLSLHDRETLGQQLWRRAARRLPLDPGEAAGRMALQDEAQSPGSLLRRGEALLGKMKP
jgi:hypothetical protein